MRNARVTKTYKGDTHKNLWRNASHLQLRHAVSCTEHTHKTCNTSEKETAQDNLASIAAIV